MTRLVLASGSAARAAMLKAAGVAVELAGSAVDEGLIKSGLLGRGATPREVAHTLAEEKAKAGSLAHDGLVIGADQTLNLDGRLIDKASNLDEARSRLLALRGRPHSLHSGVAVARAGELVFTAVDSARLIVRPFTDAYLDAYLSRNGHAILGSVGCYQIEGEGVQLFDTVEGDHFTILGMPLLPLLDFLRREGALPR